MTVHEKMLCSVLLEDTMTETAVILAQCELAVDPSRSLTGNSRFVAVLEAPTWDDTLVDIWMDDSKGWG